MTIDGWILFTRTQFLIARYKTIKISQIPNITQSATIHQLTACIIQIIIGTQPTILSPDLFIYLFQVNPTQDHLQRCDKDSQLLHLATQ